MNRGLSSSATKLNDTLLELLTFAEDTLRDREVLKRDMPLPSYAAQADWHRFPVYLLATAGFRRLRPDQREGGRESLMICVARRVTDGEAHSVGEPLPFGARLYSDPEWRRRRSLWMAGGELRDGGPAAPWAKSAI